MVLLRTAETTTEAKNVDLLISDIHGAHDSSDICKALRLANLSIIRKKPEEEAINLLKKVILMDTRFSVAHTLLSALHHNRNAYKESIWWAKEAIKQDPTQFNAYRPMAVSQEHLIECKLS